MNKINPGGGTLKKDIVYVVLWHTEYKDQSLKSSETKDRSLLCVSVGLTGVGINFISAIMLLWMRCRQL